MIFYAGAALPEDVWARLDRVAVTTRGRRIFMTSSWGMTETAPICTAAHLPAEHSGNIGIPAPGVSVRMVRDGDTHELRVKGPNVTPGYLARPDLTREAFDEDGWYRSGDAGRLVDANDPSRGLFFDGRIVEDFKLSSGTFVRVGTLRLAILSATAPALQDVVVVGEDRDYIALLAWPALDGAREVAGDESIQDLAATARSRACRLRTRTLRREAARVLNSRKTSAADERAAVLRRKRDHGQGLHQPARCAEKMLGAHPRALRRAARAESRRNRLTRTSGTVIELGATTDRAS